MPTQSLYNKMGFLEQPSELKLYAMEDRPLAVRIPFMQILDLPCGGQKLVCGDIVHVPVDIAPMFKEKIINNVD